MTELGSVDRIDISEPLTEICRRLGLVPANVAKLVLTPRAATATVHKLNEDGQKYLDPDEPAVETIAFWVRT